jgi:hypothetical protein
MAQLTPIEAIKFSADMRLEMSEENKVRKVERLIVKLGL